MKYEEFPKNIQKQIDEMKHYSQTIQSDVLDALESAESPEEFRSQVDSSMDEIISEAQKVREVLGMGKRYAWLRKIFHPFPRNQAKSSLLTARIASLRLAMSKLRKSDMEL